MDRTGKSHALNCRRYQRRPVFDAAKGRPSCNSGQFRLSSLLKVDFVVPSKGRIYLVEAKATQTPKPEMATPMRALCAAWAKHGSNPTRDLELYLVHRPSKSPTRSMALTSGAKALPWREFLALL